jgi:AbrB family looped-hinge helix DNA binding protein
LYDLTNATTGICSQQVGNSDKIIMSSTRGTTMPLVKVQPKGQVTLPSKLREKAGIGVGDYVEVIQEGGRIVLTPQEIAPRHPVIDAALEEGLADERAGRMTPAFSSMKEYRAWRKTPEGKKFSKS